MGAPAARASELASHWAQAGHEVSVLTGFPNHPTGVVPAEWRGRLRRLTYHELIYQKNAGDRKSTRLNSSHQIISYAVFCLKKKKNNKNTYINPIPKARKGYTPKAETDLTAITSQTKSNRSYRIWPRNYTDHRNKKTLYTTL